MSTDFKLALERTLIWEGGDKVTDNPNDPGGLTKFGISKRAYPKLDIRSLTKEQAAEIYRLNYWDPVTTGVEDQRAAESLFDLCVNLGKTNGIRVAQRSLGVLVDGVIGPKTLAAINQNPSQFVKSVAIERIRWYTNICKNKPTQREFIIGWVSRALSFA